MPIMLMRALTVLALTAALLVASLDARAASRASTAPFTLTVEPESARTGDTVRATITARGKDAEAVAARGVVWFHEVPISLSALRAVAVRPASATFIVTGPRTRRDSVALLARWYRAGREPVDAERWITLLADAPPPPRPPPPADTAEAQPGAGAVPVVLDPFALAARLAAVWTRVATSTEPLLVRVQANRAAARAVPMAMRATSERCAAWMAMPARPAERARVRFVSDSGAAVVPLVVPDPGAADGPAVRWQAGNDAAMRAHEVYRRAFERADVYYRVVLDTLVVSGADPWGASRAADVRLRRRGRVLHVPTMTARAGVVASVVLRQGECAAVVPEPAP